MSSPIININLVSRAQLVQPNGLVTYTWQRYFQQTPVFNFGVHGARAGVKASDLANGSEFFETDRTVTYKSINGVWTYISGICSGFQSQLPTDLGAADAGFLMNVSDFGHLLRWTGTQWEWAPGDDGSGYIVEFLVPPGIVGWQLCDGSVNVLTLQSDGSLSANTLPNTPGFYFRT